MRSLVLQEAHKTPDLETVTTVLRESGLPSADIRDGPGRFFLARHDGSVVGVGGLEVLGHVGLLRSVAVISDRRGEGLGTAICEALEDQAVDSGIDELYLLTTTAESFFDTLGYSRCDRTAVPPPIQETTEFTDLCPDTAVCMRKQLTDR